MGWICCEKRFRRCCSRCKYCRIIQASDIISWSLLKFCLPAVTATNFCILAYFIAIDLSRPLIELLMFQIFTNKLKYIEDYRLIDGRLIICAIAVGTALFALVWDYLYPFPLSRYCIIPPSRGFYSSTQPIVVFHIFYRPYLIYCVVFYFSMMGVLTLYVTYVEQGVFVIIIQRDPTGFDPDIVWEASSTLDK